MRSHLHLRIPRPTSFASAFALVLAVAGLSSCGSSATARASPLNVSVHEFGVSLSVASLPAGKVRVLVANDGKTAHELVAFRTDLDEGALPLVADRSKVNEDGPGITHIDPEAEDVQPGGNKTITLDLPAGRYVLICNLPTHYTLGMHAALTVS